jgi:hypothetical protein
MKPSPSKSMKTTGRKKRSREEAAGSAGGSTPPISPPRPNPNKEWKKSKAKTEDLLALLNNPFLREKEDDMWRAATGDPYPMEKNLDEIPMFTWFLERGLAFSFMKRRVQPLMARDTLGYQYTGEGDSSWMFGSEIDDDDIIDRLGRIFKDMPAYTPCLVPEYSAAYPPNEVNSRTQCRVLNM